MRKYGVPRQFVQLRPGSLLLNSIEQGSSQSLLSITALSGLARGQSFGPVQMLKHQGTESTLCGLCLERDVACCTIGAWPSHIAAR